MNRSRNIISVILIALFITGVALASLFSIKRFGISGSAPHGTALYPLSYCGEDQVPPCVVSFSLDANDQMLINLLLPDNAPADLYLKISHTSRESLYECRRLSGTLHNAYCRGEKMPPGILLHLVLITGDNKMLLAAGDLAIIGLAYPTLKVLSPAEAASPQGFLPRLSPTPPSAIPQTPPFPTRTPGSYPNYP